jgi:hypothetical protein
MVKPKSKTGKPTSKKVQGKKPSSTNFKAKNKKFGGPRKPFNKKKTQHLKEDKDTMNSNKKGELLYFKTCR